MQSHAVMRLCLGTLVVAGCNNSDRVLFVTDTGIGIGYDTKPPYLSIDYHRFEGYTAPTYENGALPPVVARIQANLNVFSPKVQQTYATGSAAVLLTQPQPKQPTDLPLLGRTGKVGYFATDSTIGLKVSFDGTTAFLPSAANLGYRRKEFSWIPVGTAQAGLACDENNLSTAAKLARITLARKSLPDNATAEQIDAVASQIPIDCYADTLASIKLGGTIDSAKATELQLDQFVATGTVARNLAADPTGSVRTHFLNNLSEAGTPQ